MLMHTTLHYCCTTVLLRYCYTAGGWSELTYWQRIWDKATRSYGTYGSHNITELMVNAMYKEDDISAPMREFCAANGATFGVQCTYYRLQG
jgi:hypothetical protein